MSRGARLAAARQLVAADYRHGELLTVGNNHHVRRCGQQSQYSAASGHQYHFLITVAMYAYKWQTEVGSSTYADEESSGCHRLIRSALKPTTRSCASTLSRVSRVSSTQQHAFETAPILLPRGYRLSRNGCLGYKFVVKRNKCSWSYSEARVLFARSVHTIGALRQLRMLSMRVRISAGTCSSLRNISPQDRQTCDASGRKEVNMT